MFKVPKETVYQWRKKNTGPPSFRIGKYVRYDPAVVYTYIAQRMAADRTAA
jgi:predicted DNA-binding transcriptional regulator AlpA